jgi:hypothetical protein
VNFLLIVTNGDGEKLCGTDFVKSRFGELKGIEGYGSVICRLRKLPLRPGTYFLIILIENAERILDRLGMIGPFAVKPSVDQEFIDPWRYGVFDVEAHWALDFSPPQS